jgi:Fe2+ or Zn2+ uptake regulation protein
VSLFRLTPQREAVLDVVRRATDHPTALQILNRVRQGTPSIGVATVYRALDLLVAHGAIKELTLGDRGSARYDGNPKPHQHVRCTRCGRVADVSIELPRAAASAAEAASGFTVTSYDVQFSGVCAECTR